MRGEESRSGQAAEATQTFLAERRLRGVQCEGVVLLASAPANIVTFVWGVLAITQLGAGLPKKLETQEPKKQDCGPARSHVQPIICDPDSLPPVP